MSVTDEQLAAVRSWRDDNPATTVPLEAFGITWQVPAQLSLDLILWQAELQAMGRTFDDLDALETERFIVGVVGPDVFAAWRDLQTKAIVTNDDIGQAAGRAFADKIIRGRTATGGAEAGMESEPTTSSPTGTSSSPTSLASTPPNPFTGM